MADMVSYFYVSSRIEERFGIPAVITCRTIGRFLVRGLSEILIISTGKCDARILLIGIPVHFAGTPELQCGAGMDVLSEVLRAVKLDGVMFHNAEFSAPWCVRSPASRSVASYPSPDSKYVIIYHLLTEGRLPLQYASPRDVYALPSMHRFTSSHTWLT